MTTIIERVEAAVKRLKDSKRPTKSLRVTREHHEAICAEASPAQRAAMGEEFVMANGIVCPPGAYGHWDKMRFVLVTGHNDLDSEPT